MKTGFYVVSSLVVISISAAYAIAASTTGTAQMTVIAPISIVAQSPLVFPRAASGDRTAVVPPGTAEDSANASFLVSGQPNTAYSIQLPSSSIIMTTGAGGIDQTIPVSDFKSFPAEGANGMIGPGGTQNLFVGATRAALPITQVAGSYTGTFTVTVVY